MKSLITVILILAPSIVLGASRRHAVAPPAFPDCSGVSAVAGVTFTRDQGTTVIPFAETVTGTSYSYGLVAADRLNLFAWRGQMLLGSNDAGCTWRGLAAHSDAELFPPRLLIGTGNRVYVWSDNRQFLARYDQGALTVLNAPAALVGVGVDPGDGTHLLAGAADGGVWESADAGTIWTPVGRLVAPWVYRFAFDPRNLNHIVAGVVTGGAYASDDGGRTWRKATGFGASGANVFNLVVSPADSATVWAMGLDLAESNGGSEGRHIYLSRDGGASFASAVDGGPGVTLINGPTMAAHPTNRDIVYFVFGTYFQSYGTDLFRYDAASRSLSVTHNAHDDIDAIAFSPADPGVMYLGIEWERPSVLSESGR